MANYGNRTVSEFAPGLDHAHGGRRGDSIVAGIGVDDLRRYVQSGPGPFRPLSPNWPQIRTTASGRVTIGDSQPDRQHPITTAKLATTAGAATNIVQSTTGSGTIVLDDSSGGTAIDGNGGLVSLTPEPAASKPRCFDRHPVATKGFAAMAGASTCRSASYRPSVRR